APLPRPLDQLEVEGVHADALDDHLLHQVHVEAVEGPHAAIPDVQPAVDLFRDLLGHDHAAAGHAVPHAVAARPPLARLGPRPGTPLRVPAVGFDLLLGRHGATPGWGSCARGVAADARSIPPYLSRRRGAVFTPFPEIFPKAEPPGHLAFPARE